MKTGQELINKKKQLKESIETLIIDFEKETGLCVSKIEPIRQNLGYSDNGIFLSVYLTINI